MELTFSLYLSHLLDAINETTSFGKEKKNQRTKEFFILDRGDEKVEKIDPT